MDRDIRFLKGIGEKRARSYQSLGVRTVRDLLRFYPRTYQDFSQPVPIGESPVGEICCISAMVASPVRTIRIRKGMTLYRFRAEDDTGACEITFFNNRFIPDLLKTGMKYRFSGRMEGSFFKRQMASPEFDVEASGTGLLPVYPSTEGLPARSVRTAVRQALALCAEPEDPLPDAMRQKYALCHLGFALYNIHFPKTRQALETARRRLVFEELLALELGMLTIRGRSRAEAGDAFPKPPDFSAFYASLPFTPTNAQKRAIEEAAEDMQKPVPMNRLIEGDVGSGKTVVAAALCLYAAQCGFQSAMMAPTEILAAQHYNTLRSLLEPCGVTVGILSGGMTASEKKQARGLLENRQIDVAVGTHALLQEGVAFGRLGLVVTDEQHRFGVAQRAVLASKGNSPHTMIMSATPIPRTLALIIYGDLDLSVLDELPAGRQQIKTYCVDSAKRKRVYQFIRQHLDKGNQAYIVCPLVEADESGIASVEEYARKLAAEDFRDYRVGLLHGRLKPKEKEAVMRDFSEGALQLLVSTTVIEVGVDVPNAIVMVVENAERFGLSQLHQLRGRVGRGSAQSYCILISDARSGETAKRLSVMTHTSDGFKIAEQDLKLRGPGDFFGRRQHGLPQLRIADMAEDASLLADARTCAIGLLADDPSLEHSENKGLREMTAALFADETVIFN